MNTDNETRDEHLRKEGYFDAGKYPRIRLVATSVSGPDKSGHYTLIGKLTIKSTTKDISFPFLATPLGDDIIFKGDFTINRRDFDVGGGSTLSNNLTVSLTVLAKKNNEFGPASRSRCLAVARSSFRRPASPDRRD